MSSFLDSQTIDAPGKLPLPSNLLERSSTWSYGLIMGYFLWLQSNGDICMDSLKDEGRQTSEQCVESMRERICAYITPIPWYISTYALGLVWFLAGNKDVGSSRHKRSRHLQFCVGNTGPSGQNWSKILCRYDLLPTCRRHLQLSNK
jgi:hypothetical protein